MGSIRWILPSPSLAVFSNLLAVGGQNGFHAISADPRKQMPPFNPYLANMRLLCEVRQPCQVLAKDVDSYRSEHEHQAHPHAPVTVHAPPVSGRNPVPGGLFVCLPGILSNNMRSLVTFRPFVSVLTVVGFTHCWSAFHFQLRISGKSSPCLSM